MLLRCGGNVIEVGRRQIAVVSTAALILLIVSIYSLGFLHSSRPGDVDRIQPIQLDQVLRRSVRDHHLNNGERGDQSNSLKQRRSDIRRKSIKDTRGLVILLYDVIMH